MRVHRTAAPERHTHERCAMQISARCTLGASSHASIVDHDVADGRGLRLCGYALCQSALIGLSDWEPLRIYGFSGER